MRKKLNISKEVRLVVRDVKAYQKKYLYIKGTYSRIWDDKKGDYKLAKTGLNKSAYELYDVEVSIYSNNENIIEVSCGCHENEKVSFVRNYWRGNIFREEILAAVEALVKEAVKLGGKIT
jgi:hypothetical protein